MKMKFKLLTAAIAGLISPIAMVLVLTGALDVAIAKRHIIRECFKAAASGHTSQEDILDITLNLLKYYDEKTLFVASEKARDRVAEIYMNAVIETGSIEEV